MRFGALVGLAGASLLASCSLLVDLTTLGDASAIDGGSEGGSGNLLTNADFEHSVGGCGPGWTTNNASMAAVDASHSGGWACEVCTTKPGVSYLTATPPVKNPPLGSTFFVQAYLKIEPDASLGSTSLYISENIASGSKTMVSQNADLANAGWQFLDTTTSPFDDAGTGVQYNIVMVSGDGGGGCVLVDDTQMLPL